MQGGVVQGIGWALNEEYVFDKEGRMENSSFLDYRMPTSLDLPMISTVIVMGAAGLMWGCGLAMKQGTPMLAAMSWPFLPFHAVQGLIDPEALYETGNPNRSDLVTVRVTRVFASVLSAAVYLAITYSIYRNMIRGFDMTVRRQTA